MLGDLISMCQDGMLDPEEQAACTAPENCPWKCDGGSPSVEPPSTLVSEALARCVTVPERSQAQGPSYIRDAHGLVHTQAYIVGCYVPLWSLGVPVSSSNLNIVHLEGGIQARLSEQPSRDATGRDARGT